MDNFNVNVTGEGEEMLRKVFALFDKSSGHFTHRITGYEVLPALPEPVPPTTGSDLEILRDRAVLILFDHERQIGAGAGSNPLFQSAAGYTPLPCPIPVLKAVDLALEWLSVQDYGEDEGDGDVDYKKGWHVYTDFWGHVHGRDSALLGITPTWALYGK